MPVDSYICIMLLNVSLIYCFNQVHCDATIAFPLLVAGSFAKKAILKSET